MAMTPGSRLGRYTILSPLGAGQWHLLAGQGLVYGNGIDVVGIDVQLPQQVVLDDEALVVADGEFPTRTAG